MQNQPSGTGIVVIVDDDPTIRFVLRRIIQEIAPSYDVVVAQHGAGAIIQIESRFVSLVITDYHMPDMDGLEVVRETKRISPQTFVVLLTGSAGNNIKQRSIEAGADYFLIKPVSLLQLRDIVILALAKHSEDGYVL